MRPRGQTASAAFPHEAVLNITFTCLFAWLMLAVFRTLIVSPDQAAVSFRTAFFSNIGASYKDFLFVAALGAISVLMVCLSRRRPWLLRTVWMLFLVCIAVSVAWGFANISLTKLLGEPFTYPWLLYADFLQNTDAKAAMRDAVNTRDALLIAGSVSAVLGLGGILGWAASRLAGSMRPLILILAAAAPLLLAGLLMRQAAASTTLEAAKTENPILHFAASLMRGTTPELFSMRTGHVADDFKPVPDRRSEAAGFLKSPATPIRNVLIFVMESTPWEYLQTYGGKYPITPNILKHAPSSFRFDNVYAHAPATNYSLFSLFTSLYPDISYYSMTAQHPGLPLKSISGVFKDRGYRTGFFWSADAKFQAFDRFLKNKYFDVTLDYRDIRCDRPIFQISSAKDQNMDYAYDVCTADTVANWIDADQDKPFFAIMMTAMTHYPYTTNTVLKPYVADGKHNEYLNALRIGDEAFGVLMDRLAASGKLDSTLVVLVGDHGQAFGQHDNYGHATALYEENVHIPLMLFNRQLFGGQSSRAVGGLIDVSPTVLDILGITKPVTWQGRSLFSSNRADRAYFFSPWRGFLFGYRDGNMKTLYNAATGKLEQYDLARDPREKVNLAADSPDVAALIAPMASWVQFQRRYVSEVVAMGDPDNPRCKLKTLSFDAAGTGNRGDPRLEVRIDGKVLASLDVPAVESRASTSAAVIAELEAASLRARPMTVRLPEIAGARTIELRFANDLWTGGASGADRNVFVKNIAANGIGFPVDRYRLVEADAGVVTGRGVELYKNGSILINGPLIDGCH